MAADMDHQYIRENNVVSLYLVGKLPQEERDRFEEHFVDCQQCLDEMELTNDFRRKLRQVAKEDGLSKDNRWAAQRGRAACLKTSALGQQPRLLAYASLLFAVSLTVVFFAGVKYHGAELAQTKRLLDDSQRRYAAGEKPGGQQQFTASLEPAPLFFLSVARGADQGNSAPENRITVPTTSPWIVLSLEFERDPDFHSYRARLSNAQGQIVWSAEKILPPPSDAIAISLASSWLSKGD